MKRDLSLLFYPPGHYDAHVRDRDRQRLLRRYREQGRADPEAYLAYWCRLVFGVVSKWEREDTEAPQ